MKLNKQQILALINNADSFEASTNLIMPHEPRYSPKGIILYGYFCQRGKRETINYSLEIKDTEKNATKIKIKGFPEFLTENKEIKEKIIEKLNSLREEAIDKLS